MPRAVFLEKKHYEVAGQLQHAQVPANRSLWIRQWQGEMGGDLTSHIFLCYLRDILLKGSEAAVYFLSTKEQNPFFFFFF